MVREIDWTEKLKNIIERSYHTYTRATIVKDYLLKQNTQRAESGIINLQAYITRTIASQQQRKPN